MINKIDHVVITTAKLDECVAFYKGIGFTHKDLGGRHELHAGDFKINVHVRGAELSPHATNVQTGSADLCFEITDDVNIFKSELIQKGYDIHLGVVERTGVKGSMESIYLYDPDGNLVEFSKY